MDFGNPAGEALVKSVWKSGASSIASDIAEVALDQRLHEGVLKEIPIFGWLLSTTNIIHSLRERIFLKKLAKFLFGVGELPGDSLEHFKKDCSANHESVATQGERLLTLIDSHNDADKSWFLGVLFAALVNDTINRNTFVFLSEAIQYIHPKVLTNYCYAPNPPDPISTPDDEDNILNGRLQILWSEQLKLHGLAQARIDVILPETKYSSALGTLLPYAEGNANLRSTYFKTNVGCKLSAIVRKHVATMAESGPRD